MPLTVNFVCDREYALFYGASSDAIPGSLEVTEQKLARYPKTDERGRFSWMNFIRTGNNDKREERPKLFYPIYVAEDNSIRVPAIQWDDAALEYRVGETCAPGEVAVFPVVFANGERVEKNWHRGHETLMSDLSEYRVRRNGSDISIDFKTRMDEDALPNTWWEKSDYASANYGAAQLKSMFGQNPFDFPKAVGLVQDCLRAASIDSNSVVLDYFAGSGTTAEAVLSLNRLDSGQRRFILVDVGPHCRTIIRPRVAKAIYSDKWDGGRAMSHDKGVSSIVKYFALESYEDALSNLPAASGTLLDGRSDVEKDALFTYGLDLELGPHLLDLEAFRDPWGYTINAQLAGDAEIKPHRVDLVETFNYLIGLKVHAYARCVLFDYAYRSFYRDGYGKDFTILMRTVIAGSAADSDRPT